MYHLKKKNLTGQKPKNAKEVFSLWYSSLRNDAVEQIFENEVPCVWDTPTAVKTKEVL